MSLWIELKCDLCNKLFDSVYYTRDAVTELKKNAKAAGWQIGYQGNTVCAECQKKRETGRKQKFL